MCDWETRRLREAARDVRRSLKRHTQRRLSLPRMAYDERAFI
jgi:hypothetical protein